MLSSEQAMWREEIWNNAVVLLNALPSHHDRARYVTFMSTTWSWSPALINSCSYLNIMSTLELIGISWSRILEQLIKVSGFEGKGSFLLWYVNLDLTIGPIWAATHFNVIDSSTSYNLLFGDFGFTNTRMSAPHTINASKPSRKVRKFILMLLGDQSKGMKLIFASSIHRTISWRWEGCSTSTSRCVSVEL